MMHEVRLRLACNNPEIVKKSIEPDMTNTEDTSVEISACDGFVEISVKGKKLSHLKAIINSYLSIISALDEIEKLE